MKKESTAEERSERYQFAMRMKRYHEGNRVRRAYRICQIHFGDDCFLDQVQEISYLERGGTECHEAKARKQ